MFRTDFEVEICANGVESCIAAQEGGADRVELCAGIPEGGTTPSWGEMVVARKVLTTTRLHVIIRPRGGDFCYTDLELERMELDIDAARKAGADGVVFGCLTPDGDVDMVANARLMKRCEGMSVTFHRAFDRARDAEKALDDCIKLGFNRILTSGQQANALLGVPMLKKLQAKTAGRIILMAGCGVNEENIDEIREKSGVSNFHFSAREIKPSTMKYMNPDVFMGSPSAKEDGVPYTTANRVKNTIAQLLKTTVIMLAIAMFNVLPANAQSKEKEALKFLYSYMPLADRTDYPESFFMQNIRMSYKAQGEMPWGKDVPELLFRHFVLPIRVNNEPLDSSRTVFYRELKDRVKNLPMKEAILEVNHWCHEHVVYEPSDARTSSPLQSVRTAAGRCGEESTFLVAALRSVGIPARQVYTPRWAHTDDNHAWVEAWADGKWWFLGACEPEAVLNLGWFNAPASRAMLMHTRAFGDYRGPEEVMLRTTNFTEINLIDNYGSSARVDFKVVDEKGRAVNDARVDFQIYNYAEFCTVASKYTDKAGKTFLTAGKGDMLVWASKNGAWGYAKSSFGKDKIVTIKLTKKHDMNKLDEINIVPPPEQANMPYVSAEAQEHNKQRLAIEDSIRAAYTSTFIKGDKALQYPEDEREFLIKARGNWRVILAFLNKYRNQHERCIALLKTLRDKDLRDMPMDILEDNMLAPTNQLCPRVEDEMITRPFKQFFAGVFSKDSVEMFRHDPSLLVEWVRRNIKMNPDKKALRIAQTPMGVWESRMTDTRSRDIFFVDLARSLNIEAQKDVVTGRVQYKYNGEWLNVNFDTDKQEKAAAPKGTLVLAFQPQPSLDNPKYYSQFTIARVENGRSQLLNFEEGQVDMGGGTSWENTFKNGTPLETGTYMLTTGNRLASGSVLAATTLFTIEEGKTTTVPLVIRENTEGVSVIGNFDSESKYLTLPAKGEKQVEKSVLAQTGRGYYVIGILGTGQEPTNHALKDIVKVRKQLEEWGRPFLFLFENETDAKRFNIAEFGTLPANHSFGLDINGTIKNQIVKGMKLQSETQLPIFIIADTFNRVVFVSQGYTIGLGEQLLKVLGKI